MNDKIIRGPATKETQVIFLEFLEDKYYGWDGRGRTYGLLRQKQAPYHLATSQHDVFCFVCVARRLAPHAFHTATSQHHRIN